MAWTINYSEQAVRQLKKMDRQVARRLADFLDTRIATSEDPRANGKALRGNLSALWRYRVGDYRIVCDIQDQVLTVLVLEVGSRQGIYE